MTSDVVSEHWPGTRVATVDDLGELVRLAGLAREHIATLKGGSVFLARDARPSAPERSLQTDLDRPDGLVLLGLLGETPVGYSVGRIESLPDGRLAVITDLFVEVDARGVGVGERLMAAMVEWATRHDCTGIDALTLPGDRDTKNFFEGFGLVARAITVHRVIDDIEAAGSADIGDAPDVGA